MFRSLYKNDGSAMLRRMNSRLFRPAVLLLSSCLVAFAADRPNVLLIVSDDHGYADTGFQGCSDIPTPHLDRLAKAGLRCSNGYVTHPFCSPTRAGLMTGRYQQRFGHEGNPFYDPDDHREGLPTSERLLPEFMREAGYVTGWIGKWHLGAAPEFRPLKRGFLETYGFIGGGHRYRDWKTDVKVEYGVPIERNGEPVEAPAHLTEAFGREAAAFIGRHKDQPWFLYLAFNAPHTPHEPTAERLAKFASIADEKRRNYAAQVSLLDDAIGTTLDALRESGQDQRTLVFFFSDNGGPIGPRGNGSANGLLRGGKGTTYDGGIRVPFVVSWPTKLPAGKDYDQPVSSVDVFATALAAAGSKMPTDRKYDSVNLLPFLTGEQAGAPHERLYWRSGPQAGLREGDWKLVRHGTVSELYNLKSDLGENSDLFAKEPKTAKRLVAALDAWNAELVPPAFMGAGGRKPAAKQRAP